MEAEASYNFDKHWKLKANYTYLDARDSGTNKRLSDRALNSGTVELSWTDAKRIHGQLHYILSGTKITLREAQIEVKVRRHPIAMH